MRLTDAMTAGFRRRRDGIAAGFAPMVNAAEPVGVVEAAVRGLGAPLFTDKPPVMGSEDFAFMLDRVPGAYLNGERAGVCAASSGVCL